MIIHADHGGGNNSTFTTRCITSTGTDTYSAIAAGIGSLKGPKHGGANIQVHNMIADLKKTVSNPTDEGQVADYLTKVIHKEAGDRTGLIYGMGHAVYTLSDPRAVLLKEFASQKAEKYGFADDYKIISLVESLLPSFSISIRAKRKKCAQTWIFIRGLYTICSEFRWSFSLRCLWRQEFPAGALTVLRLCSGSRIMRPAYKSVALPRAFVPIAERNIDHIVPDYVPSEER